MKKMNCPNCGAKMSILKKILLDPKNNVKCKDCDCRLAIPKWTVMLNFFTRILIVFVLVAFRENQWRAGVVSGAIVITFVLLAIFAFPVIKYSDYDE